MELVPPAHEHSTKESHSAAEHAQRRWAGRIAIHSPYEPGTTAYSDLGGGLPSHRSDLDTPKYPTGLDETILFADKLQRESVPPTYVEILRAYDLALDRLTPADLDALSIAHRNMIAVAGHDLLSKVRHRAQVLTIDGNFDNPVFSHYAFTSQEEANIYAEQLSLLHHDLMTREVVIAIESTYSDLKQHSRSSTMKDLAKQVRDLTVHITKDHKVQLGHKEYSNDQ